MNINGVHIQSYGWPASAVAFSTDSQVSFFPKVIITASATANDPVTTTAIPSSMTKPLILNTHNILDKVMRIAFVIEIWSIL